MSFQVSEQVRFCYGHRLLDYQGRCARLHGHNARVEIVAAAAALDGQGFVVDFGALESAARAFVDGFDHQLLLRADDPLIPLLQQAREPFVALPVNPTAENLAKLIFEHLQALGLPVCAIRFWETESSVASYQP